MFTRHNKRSRATTNRKLQGGIQLLEDRYLFAADLGIAPVAAEPVDATDYIYGGAGRDSLYGEGSWDALYGESGDDYLNGGHDGYYDWIVGGSGADRFEVHGWWWTKEYDNFRDVNVGDGDQLV